MITENTNSPTPIKPSFPKSKLIYLTVGVSLGIIAILWILNTNFIRQSNVNEIVPETNIVDESTTTNVVELDTISSNVPLDVNLVPDDGQTPPADTDTPTPNTITPPTYTIIPTTNTTTPSTDTTTPPEQVTGTVDPDFAVVMPDWKKTAWGTTLFSDNHITTKPRIVEINMKGEVIWQYFVPAGLTQYTNPGFDIEVLPNNNVLFVLPRNGVYEINRKGETVWSFKDVKVSHDADRLPNGNTLIAFGANDRMTDSQVREIDPSGKVVWSWKAADHFNTPEYNTISAEGWTHTNAVERLSNGNTMISPRNFNFIVEVDKNGNVVRKVGEGILTEQHDPVMLKNGNILVADHGKPQSVMELDSNNNIVWRFVLTDITDFPARDADKLSNGNILITTARRIFELTPEKEIVWEMKLTIGPFTQQESAARGFYKAVRSEQ